MKLKAIVTALAIGRGRSPSRTQLRRRWLAALVAWSFEDSDAANG